MQRIDMSADGIERLKESYRDSVRRWRAQAANVRTAAQQSHLTLTQRMTLLRQADACEEQVAFWEKALREEFGEVIAPT